MFYAIFAGYSTFQQVISKTRKELPWTERIPFGTSALLLHYCLDRVVDQVVMSKLP